MKEIELRQTKVNYLELINMNLNKQEWGKKYVLYTYGRLTVTCEMTKFEFKSQEATFELYVTFYDNDAIFRSRIDWAYYKINNFNENQFRNYVVRRIISKINDELRSIKKEEAEEKFSELKYNYENVSTKTILTDAGMSEEYDAVCDLDNAYRLLEVLLEEAEEKLNAEFNREVDDYCDDNENNVIIEDVDNFLEILKKEVNYD